MLYKNAQNNYKNYKKNLMKIKIIYLQELYLYRFLKFLVFFIFKSQFLLRQIIIFKYVKYSSKKSKNSSR